MHKILIIAGPTASGKSSRAIEFAKKLKGIIINADSLQIYQDIPIITAQPSIEQQAIVEHKLYGIMQPDEEFSVAKWLNLVCIEINNAHRDGRLPIIVGGTGMYIKSLMQGISKIPDIDNTLRREIRKQAENLTNEALYKLLKDKDPKIADKLNANDKQRILRAYEVKLQTGISLLEWQTNVKVFYPKEMFNYMLIDLPRSNLYFNCNNRFDSMLESGVIEEVRQLNLKFNYPVAAKKALGFKEISDYLDHKLTLEEAKNKAKKITRNYAKRQVTWFKHQL